MPKRHKWFLFFAVMAFQLFMLYSLILLSGELKDGLASKSWPHVDGYITEFKIGTTPGDETDLVYVSYKYVVDGRGYAGNKICYSLFDDTTEDLRRRTSVSNNVVVYYNPKKESKAVLYPGVNVWLVVFFLITLILFSFGVLFQIELFKTAP